MPTDHKQEAEELMDAAWESARRSNGTDSVISIQLALAQAAATLYVGDQIARLANDRRSTGCLG
jgi:hypothetical protein